MEKELTELQCKLAKLQCQNFILGDQAQNYQNVAEKVTVWYAKYKYKKEKGKVNVKKVHAVIATAKADWDPDTWDGDIWGDTEDDDDMNWDTLDDEVHKDDEQKYPPVLQAKPLSSRHEKVQADGR